MTLSEPKRRFIALAQEAIQRAEQYVSDDWWNEVRTSLKSLHAEQGKFCKPDLLAIEIRSVEKRVSEDEACSPPFTVVETMTVKEELVTRDPIALKSKTFHIPLWEQPSASDPMQVCAYLDTKGEFRKSLQAWIRAIENGTVSEVYLLDHNSDEPTSISDASKSSTKKSRTSTVKHLLKKAATLAQEFRRMGNEHRGFDGVVLVHFAPDEEDNSTEAEVFADFHLYKLGRHFLIDDTQRQMLLRQGMPVVQGGDPPWTRREFYSLHSNISQAPDKSDARAISAWMENEDRPWWDLLKLADESGQLLNQWLQAGNIPDWVSHDSLNVSSLPFVWLGSVFDFAWATSDFYSQNRCCREFVYDGSLYSHDERQYEWRLRDREDGHCSFPDDLAELYEKWAQKCPDRYCSELRDPFTWSAKLLESLHVESADQAIERFSKIDENRTWSIGDREVPYGSDLHWLHGWSIKIRNLEKRASLCNLDQISLKPDQGAEKALTQFSVRYPSPVEKINEALKWCIDRFDGMLAGHVQSRDEFYDGLLILADRIEVAVKVILENQVSPSRSASINSAKESNRDGSYSDSSIETAEPNRNDSDLLKQRQGKFLIFLYEQNATSQEKRKNADTIAAAVVDPRAISNDIKQDMSELRRFGYVRSKIGKGGGYWLTDLGIKWVREANGRTD